MKLPVRALIAPALLVCVAALCERANSQIKSDNKTAEATVSGKVTIKGKPAAGIVVSMRLSQPDESSATYKAKTDQEGIYHITRVAAGSYVVAPFAPALVLPDSNNRPQGQSVIITESENVDGINFDLVPGGVITGRVADSEGHPLIEERISLTPADERDQRGPLFMNSGSITDDRGVYRIFGVPAGRYKVSVGDLRFNPGIVRRKTNAQTFYPDVTEAAKAGIVEISEGTEATKIDITVGEEAAQGYSVSGRIFDSDTGDPVPNVGILLTRIIIINPSNTSGYGENTDVRSDAQGQFRLTNIRAGKYDLSINPPEDSDMRVAASARFDVIDQDVSGLVVKTARGASIAGTVVFEGARTNDPRAVSQMWLMMDTRSEANHSSISSSRSVHLKPDGSFFAGGLTAGVVNLSVETGNRSKGMTVARVERDGVVQPNGIQIQNGEHINGVRLVLAFSSGSIRGVVRIENGTLPPTARMIITLSKAGEANPMPRGAEVDSRGHFLIEGLAAGSYEVRVLAYAPEWRRNAPVPSKQIVNVTEGAATDVILTLDLTPSPNQ